jgi:alkylation response protein AidB-like acyl-CoA dehydrogenase
MRLLNWQLTAAVDANDVNVAEASAAKVFGTETHAAVCRTLFNLLGSAGARRGLDGVAAGRVETLARGAIVNTFGGGVNEVMRDLIAVAGLGMPRGNR